MKYSIAIAGSTKFTVAMAQAIAKDERFDIALIITPNPKLIGRKQILTKNPLQKWAEEQGLKLKLIDKKIQQADFADFDAVDFLLVVDFGYIVPNWLLEKAKIAPLNIHPSLLPKWRGSSPGQFSLLFQDLEKNGKESAITLMKMSAGLDQGPIIKQLPFEIKENWTQDDYYQTAFALMSEKLPDLITDFAQNKTVATNQPEKSPTMIARSLSKQDSFVSWENLQILMNKSSSKIPAAQVDPAEKQLLNQLLKDENLCSGKKDQINLIVSASKAFFPWPGLWTEIPTSKGQLRMKIFSCERRGDEQLVLDKVQVEGKTVCTFNECKNVIV